jgi:phage gpG-like protein
MKGPKYRKARYAPTGKELKQKDKKTETFDDRLTIKRDTLGAPVPSKEKADWFDEHLTFIGLDNDLQEKMKKKIKEDLAKRLGY